MVQPNTELRRVLLRGLDPAVNLAGMLNDLDDTSVRTKEEASAICNVLGTIPSAEEGEYFTSRLHAVTGLFQDVATEEAFETLRDHGVRELCRIFDELEGTDDAGTVDDLLFVLKILAMYRTGAGTERVVQAARKPLKPDAYMWSMILGQFDEDHVHAERALEELSDPLPEGFLAVALLDCANGHAIHGGDGRHPFDSPAGKKRLQAWLTNRDEEEFSYAHSATASLPFITNPERDELIALAMDHPDTGVQMEAAWASAKLGSNAGIKVLARYCLDPNCSAVACRYLSELGRDDAVPSEALDPDFQAKAEFANWLSHPNELGRPPDELQIVDRRELAWPPDGERMPFWLIRYRLKDATGLEDDDVDCGLVGSVTFCLFSYKLAERPPEDAYAIHCYWEMEGQGLIDETAAADADENYEELLQQWRGEPLHDAEMICVAGFQPKLGYPQPIVGLAAATRNAEEGWVVLDGERSAWYPKSDMPKDAHPATVLKVHVGRRLLGFEGRPDRKRFLAKERRPRDPQAIIEAYDKLLAEATGGDESRRKQWFDLRIPLAKHFDAYVDARVAVQGTAREEIVIEVYEQLLGAARESSEGLDEDAIGSVSPLGENFEKYVDALVATGRAAKVEALIELFAPHWDHNLGYGQLGKAAFRCERFDVAERYFVKLRDSLKDAQRCEEMSLLAEIWHRQGQSQDAHELLIDCMRKLVAESKTATGSDRKLFEDWFQQHRSTYLRLFPELGDATLTKHGIPSTTRR